ncbi:ATP-binding cassette domain-containing protein [Desulfurispora thermophila]|uniref:ATP-binding cassette domain-containing protein n=1 Tax=Desulfurispora thermophila TaxID=265470 RepID=UPI00037D8ED2|nr:ATP-binding cassette domain-containing protein [Desulfurispora thermophila]
MSYQYQGQAVPALIDFSATVAPGEHVAVVGANGSGKSTLAGLAACLLLPTAGEVLIAGVKSDRVRQDLSLRRKVGLVLQNPDNQIVAATVEEDVAFGLENLGVPREEMWRRVEEALSVTGMEELRLCPPHQLSGGQKQRLALAGILAMRPEVIILDEPTAMLDPVGRREIIQWLLRIKACAPVTIMYITHHLEETLVADRVWLLQKGRLAADLPPLALYTQNRELVEQAGLSLPPLLELVHRLERGGVPLPAGIAQIEQLVDALCRLLS